MWSYCLKDWEFIARGRSSTSVFDSYYFWRLLREIGAIVTVDFRASPDEPHFCVAQIVWRGYDVIALSIETFKDFSTLTSPIGSPLFQKLSFALFTMDTEIFAVDVHINQLHNGQFMLLDGENTPSQIWCQPGVYTQFETGLWLA